MIVVDKPGMLTTVQDLGRHGLPVLLRPADELHAPRRADVLHVVPAADRAIEQQIARDHQLLCFRGNRRQAEHSRDQAGMHRPAT